MVVVSDSGVRGRVRGLLGTPPEVAPELPSGAAYATPVDATPEAAAQHQALHVLTLAQRTADEHLNSARQQASRICADARESAAQIVQEAHDRAEARQREAETAVSEARAAAEQLARDAQSHAEQLRQDAEEILSGARIRGDEVAKHAQAEADELQHLAQQRYEDVVGSLAARREALQQQIEALEQFDREYRARLQSFMQSQLRALWVDEPRVDAGGLEDPPPALRSVPEHSTYSDQLADTSPDS